MKNSILICVALVGALFCTTGLSALEPDDPAIASADDIAGVSRQIAALNEQAGDLLAKGDVSNALPLQAEALRLSREVLGERHPDTLLSLNNYAGTLARLGRSAEAEPLIVEALRLRREVLGERHPDTLTSLNNYAATLDGLGRSAEAEPLIVEALRLRREVLGERHPDTLTSLYVSAEVLHSLGRSDEAALLIDESLRLRREVLGERHPDTLASLDAHAFLLGALGTSDEAEPIFAESLRLRQEVLGERHPDTLTSLRNYARELRGMGRWAEAQPLFAEALRLNREVLGERHPDTLTVLKDYAMGLIGEGRANEAEPLLFEALRLTREHFGDQNLYTIISLQYYAYVLWSLERLPESEPLLAEALSVSREVLGERHRITLSILNDYAELLIDLNRAAEAHPILDKALHLNREVLGERDSYTLHMLRIYTHSLLDHSRVAAALPLSQDLVEATRSRAVDLAGKGIRGGEQSHRELSDRQSIERLHADVLWSNLDSETVNRANLAVEAFRTLQLASADSTTRAVVAAAASRFATDRGLDQLVQERQTLIREWPAIEAELIETQAGGEAAAPDRGKLRSQLQAIEKRVDEIDARLAAEAPQYFAILNQQSVELEQLRAILGPEEAVLLLAPTLHGTHIMVVTRESFRWQKSDPPLSNIEDAVGRLRKGLEIEGDGALPEFDLQLAHKFYDSLIAPVEDALEGKQRVYVIADGPLSRLPLGVFLTSPPPEGADFNDPQVLRDANWLADRYALVQLPSIQSLVYIRSFGAKGKLGTEGGFHGFGAPVLTGAASLRGARSATLSPVDASGLIATYRDGSGKPLMDTEALRRLASLPGTRSELVQVQRALGASEDAIFLDERMTETAVRTLDLSQTSILHFATHAFTSETAEDLAEPGLVFTPPEQATTNDDGYLAASEVVGIDLTSVAWVILSACNTASPSGRDGETGLSGLAQAFFYAGAESLLVSHWPVFDDIAPLITVETVKASIAGMPRAEALQAAMRKVRSDPTLSADHPAVWAPFTLVGEGR
ncbi:CHAT domain-containing protein [Erythrobacter donghaensis]|uniref:CHAT domain-containing protein n=1 Tax=Erythrobacter donghaensis TaxID=267135 RepID=UPI000A3698D5|nr:CHAT domain-containing tetratricopeptide repeat protein [Erythrobacter donghaensis]